MKARLETNVRGFATTGLMAGLFCLAAQRHVNWNTTGDQWTLDQGVGFVLFGAILFVLSFAAAHFALRHFRIASYFAYAPAGAAALGIAFLATGGMALIERMQEEGIASVLVAAVLLAGAAFGFLYRRGSRFAIEGDDPKALAAQLSTAAEGGAAGDDDAAHVEAAEAEYYNGPLQVRTSVGALLIAGLAAGAASILISLITGTAENIAVDGMRDVLAEADLNMGLLNIVLGTMLGGLMFPIPVYIAHQIARWRDLTSYGAYVGIGAALPIAAGLMMFIVGALLMLPYVVPMAIAMAFYRHLAGLEPKSLPEDIEVADRRTLIAANHPRRRYNRIVGG